MPFRSWVLYEYPALPQTTSNTWVVKTSNQINKPRYVILGFQTNRKNRINTNMSCYDHCNISDVKVYLNSESYPYDSLNFAENMYCMMYDMYTKFQQTYYQNTERSIDPYLNSSNFKTQAPLFVFDCSRQNDSIKSSMIDLRIEIQAKQNIPANTAAYCLVIHDNVISYNPYTNIIVRSI